MDNTQLHIAMRHIDDMLACFDFKKVEAVMWTLGWKWGLGEEASVPSIKEMKECVVDLVGMINAQHPEPSSAVHATSGGFTVTRFTDGSYKLQFVVEEHDTYLNVGKNRITQAAEEGEVEMA